MTTLKDVLCLLAILIAYGIVGRMDYDDAVMLDEAQRALVERPAVGCAAETDHSMPASDARSGRIALHLPPAPAPCWSGPHTVAVE